VILGRQFDPLKGLAGMLKQCSECQSMMNCEAPYCDSCGHQFEAQVPIRGSRTPEYVVVAIVILITAVAVAVLMRHGTI